MKKIVFRILAGMVGLFVIVFVFAIWPTSNKVLVVNDLDLQSADLIEKGKYLSVLGDCAACHSSDGGITYSGGAGAIESPIGNMYSPNITPDLNTGIGSYSLNDFDRALRYGIRQDGVSLYPAMPYPSYARLTDEDVIALYAYFKNGVEAIDKANVKNDIPWPLSIRFPVAIWRKVLAPEVEVFNFSAYQEKDIARGAYLVQGLAHCGACHTPREITLQEKGLDESSPYFLSGETLVDGWVAINLLNNDDGLKNWNEEDIIGSLRTGKNKRGSVIGKPMNEFVHESGQSIQKDDLEAIAAYLKILPAKEQLYSKFIAENQKVRPEKSDAYNLYRKNCVSCHGIRGDGNKGANPELSANPTVLADNPQSLIRVTLEGSKHLTVDEKAERKPMKAFSKLSNSEVAEIVTFIRSNWGNDAPAVTELEVKRVRDKFMLTN